MSFNSLPVILVSAANQTTATSLISELIDNDVTDDYHKDTQSPDRVWRLVNKYYTVNVRVHLLTDNGRLDVDPNAVEAHIIHITEDELKDGCGALGVVTAEARAAVAAGAWRHCGVRLLLVAAEREPSALGGWAAAERAELVPLAERAELVPLAERAELVPLAERAQLVPLAERAPSEPFGAAAGMERARAALHAHAWRGLVRTDRAAKPSPAPREPVSGSSSGGSDAEETEEERAVEHAEAFAATLGALGPALAARELGADSDAPLDVRHARAEALVAAFCRALGYELDAC